MNYVAGEICYDVMEFGGGFRAEAFVLNVLLLVVGMKEGLV